MSVSVKLSKINASINELMNGFFFCSGFLEKLEIDTWTVEG